MKSSTLFSRAQKCLGLLVMLFPLAITDLQAQNPGAVSGTLLDHGNGQVLPFANVVLLRPQDSSFVAGAQTTDNGAFIIDKVALGKYLVRATVIGYKPLRRTVDLTSAAPEAKLGPLRLISTATQLAGVTVQGERAAVEDNLDKKVINVEKDLSSVGGSAVNVLQNVPSVTVDQNGNVSMRGSSNITVLVDGKPSGSATGGMGMRLEQIPASSIERVEVITNPSARYDAAGSGGVLNIILKKQKKDGYNGQAIANLGTRDKYSTSLSLNRRTGKLNVFGSYDGRNNRWHNQNSTQQRADVEGVLLSTNQDSRSQQHGRDHNGRLGLDYTISPEQSLTVTVQPNLHRSNNVGNQISRLQTGSEQPTFQTNRTDVSENVNVLDASTDYRRTWAQHKGRELTGSLNYTGLLADVVVGQRLTEGAPDLTAWKQDFHVHLDALEFQSDYVHPLDSTGRIDAGLKSQWQTNNGTDDYLRQNADNQQYAQVPQNSFAYNFQEYLQAGYVTFQNQLGKWNYQAGVRGEYTHTQGEVRGGKGQFNLQYFNLFPSALVARKLPGDQRVQLSYSRRLNRPGFMQLLPFPIYQDQRNYRQGDPSLRPEYINSLEFGHQISKGQATLSTTLFYRQTNNSIQQFRTVDTAATRLNDAGGIVAAMSFRNYGQATSFGAEMSLNQPLTKWWRLTASGSLFRNSITAATGTEATRNNLTGTLRLLNTFNPTPKLDVQLTGNYRAAVITPQGRIEPIYNVDVALRQRLFNDRAALTLRVSDIFNTQRQRLSAYSPGYEATGNFKNETRVGYLGFSWYFGSNKPPKKIEQQPQGSGGGFGG
ncbi:TonB-dependent receptor domain-containing protein [Hymenobacter sp. BT491]|uniref:TonB-dependent receptor domain-containing protein n=1 Tax=Hymenobacter sp. BT491 TaxID=2766779 RepID=UPI001653A35B|nr:TonB-dependent receptor [Hymenobacter sp. BT491]MBC6991968.1 TonB-dependent receptor [Hymenobacter sp. BT491]